MTHPRLRLLLPLGVALAAIAAPGAHAGPGRAVGKGIVWLDTHQNPSGSWGSAYELADTCAVVETLVLADPSSPELADGAAWLSAEAAPNTELLARQIDALVRVEGYRVLARALADDLLAARNAATTDSSRPNFPEGGWGIAPGYETDCLTTAVALRALDAAGLNGGFSATNIALGAGRTNLHEWDIAAGSTKARIVITVGGSTVRLRMKQGVAPGPGDPFFSLPAGGPYLIIFPDSGIGFTAGHNFIAIQSTGPAATYSMTASFETPKIDTRSLAEAVSYLKTAQNPDGGWGIQRGAASELYTTLHVMAGLQRFAGYEVAANLASAKTALVAQQHGDGSFGFSAPPIVYVTALAALALVRSETFPYGSATNNAIAALRAMQDGPGSWAGEPYDTALAVLALLEHDQLPTAGAGSDRTVTDSDLSGAETVTLAGSGGDVDGTIDAYAWFENEALIATGPSPAVMLAIGIHDINLVVTDSDCRTATDAVRITVNPGLPGACAAVTGLTCRSQWPDVVLAWTNSAPYQRIDISLFGELLQSLPGTATTYTHAGVPQGEYTYAVTATCGDGGVSPAVPCSVFHAPPCAPVTGLRCRPFGDDVVLSWSNGDTYTSIKVYRDRGLIARLAGTATGYTDVKLLPGQYTYTVEGICSNRVPAPGVEVSVYHLGSRRRR